MVGGHSANDEKCAYQFLSSSKISWTKVSLVYSPHPQVRTRRRFKKFKYYSFVFLKTDRYRWSLCQMKIIGNSAVIVRKVRS